MKRSDSPVEKVTLNLFTGDAERIREHFPRQGASSIIRQLVRQYLRRIDEDVAQKVGPMDVVLDIKELSNENG